MRNKKFDPNGQDTKELLDFSNVTLLSTESVTRGHNSFYHVRCNHCNKEYWKAGFTFGKARCQCYKKINGAYNFQGYKGISAVYFSRVKANAKAKQRTFTITKKSMWEQWEKQKGICALSGITLVIERNYKKIKIMTASLDRIDSSKGYTDDNIQWVHKHINQMKSDHSIDYFLELCKKITNNTKKNGNKK